MDRSSNKPQAGLRRATLRRPLGFSLIEVAVALAVTAVGLSGLCALLLGAAIGSSNASERATATWLADALAHQLDLVPGHEMAAPGREDAAACTPAAPCAPAAFAKAILIQWRASLAAALPAGAGFVCRDSSPDDGTLEDPACDGAGALRIKVFWQGSQAAGMHGSMHVRTVRT